METNHGDSAKRVRPENHHTANPDGASAISPASVNRKGSLRGEHCINIFISSEFKERLKTLAGRYDRTMADMIRAILKIGIPVMEGISESEERMLKEYVRLFRKFRDVKNLREL